MAQLLSFAERGTAFEIATMYRLATLGFDLRRCGQTGDRGMDLQGEWVLPAAKRAPVVVQCKNSKHKASTNLLREFEGVLSRLSPGTIGVYATDQGYSSQFTQQVITSPFPLAICRFNQQDVIQFKINKELQRLLPSLVVGDKMIRDEQSGRVERKPRMFYLNAGILEPVQPLP